MAEQLPLDFTASISVRTRRAKAELDEQPTLFASFVPNIDVHLKSPEEAVAQISGKEPERVHAWLNAITGGVKVVKSKRFEFPTSALDKLLYLRPPAQVTLDANSLAVARALWAAKLGLRPLRVIRDQRRLIAHSRRWPAGFNVKDVPWPAIATAMHLGLPVDIDPDAQTLLARRLSESGATIAEAGLAGTAVRLETNRPEMLERLRLPALSYAGEPNTGHYKMPLLLADHILKHPGIRVSDDLRTAIKKATAPVKPLTTSPGFPWTLYGFQAEDAGRGARILATTGGVLLAGDMGSGKGGRPSDRVLTPTGWTTYGDLKVGDYVIGANGQPTTVTGVFPRGQLEIWRVTLTDKTSVTVDGDHLWTVTGRDDRQRTLATSKLRDHLEDGDGPQWAIPIVAPVQFGQPQTGGRWGRKVLPTTNDQPAEVLHRAALWGNPTQRADALRSILDEHGNPATEGIIAALEPDLAADTSHLVQSLGGTITRLYKNRHLIQLPDWLDPFTREDLLNAYRLVEHADPERRIAAIEPAGVDDIICIQVAAEDQLYVTDHYIVTHNTTVSLALAHELDLWPLLVVAPLSAFSTWARQLGEMGKNHTLATGSPAKSWEAISEGGWDAVVISYDRLHAFMEILEPYGFKGIVADELQRIRNPGSRRSRAIRSLAVAIPYRLGLSGTPLVNGAMDVLSQGAFLVPGEWPPRASSKDLEDIYPDEPIESIADHLGSLMVRRRIDQAGLDLPVRNDRRVYVDLTQEQRRALAELEEEAQRAKEDGAFEGGAGKINALTKLTRARMIVSSPRAAGIQGPNPKVQAAVEIVRGFLAEGRRGVVFATDRTSHQELVEAFRREGWSTGVMSGATSAQERIAVENQMHNGELSVIACTTQSSAESWSCTPEGTFYVSIGLMFQAAILAQAEARVYRANADKTRTCEIVYVLAKDSIDDRVVEILDQKKALFAQVVDRMTHTDPTTVHTSLSELIYMLTGVRNTAQEAAEKDASRLAAERLRRKEHAKQTIYRNKGKNRTSADNFRDDGSTATTWEDHASGGDPQLDALLNEVDLSEDGELHMTAEDLFDED